MGPFVPGIFVSTLSGNRVGSEDLFIWTARPHLKAARRNIFLLILLAPVDMSGRTGQLHGSMLQQNKWTLLCVA